MLHTQASSRRSFVGIAFASVAAMAIGTTGANAQKAGPCIGASLELTGPLACKDKQIAKGAEVAIDEIK